jgi:hypothetical protein
MQKKKAGMVPGIPDGQVHPTANRARQICHEVCGDGVGIGFGFFAAHSSNFTD